MFWNLFLGWLNYAAFYYFSKLCPIKFLLNKNAKKPLGIRMLRSEISILEWDSGYLDYNAKTHLMSFSEQDPNFRARIDHLFFYLVISQRKHYLCIPFA